MGKGILASLLVKLGLDSKEFEKGVDNAKQKTNAFASGMKALGGIIAGAFSIAAITAFLNKVKNATDTLGTQVDIFLGGVKSASDEFFRSIASWDFSNFIENMKEAVRIGREYVATLDDIESRSRAMTIAEADARAEIVALEETLRNATLSDEERIAAGQKRVQIEEELARKRAALAKQAFDNEMKMAGQASRMSSEQVLKLAADFDSEKKLRAERVNQIKKELSILEAEAAKSGAATGVLYPGMTSVTSGAQNPQIKALKEELKTFPADVLNYADSLKLLGNVTDEQMNRVVKAYSDLKTAEVSGRENIKRIITTINSLLAKEKPTGENSAADVLERTAEAYEKLTTISDIGSFADTSGNLGKLPLDIPLGFQTEAMKNAAEKEKELLDERLKNWNNFKEDMAYAVADFGVNVVEEFGQSIGEMIASGNFDFSDFGKNILAGIGGFISQLGKMMIQMGIAAGAFQKLLESAFMNPAAPGLLVAAGLGLVLLGGAIQGFAKAGPTGSSSSSSVSTPSYSRAGSTSQGYRAEDNKVVFEIKGDKLVGVLNNVQRKNLNMA